MKLLKFILILQTVLSDDFLVKDELLEQVRAHLKAGTYDKEKFAGLTDAQWDLLSEENDGQPHHHIEFTDDLEALHDEIHEMEGEDGDHLREQLEMHKFAEDL